MQILHVQIKTEGQLGAAFEFCSAIGPKKLDIKEFERFCGIGMKYLYMYIYIYIYSTREYI